MSEEVEVIEAEEFQEGQAEEVLPSSEIEKPAADSKDRKLERYEQQGSPVLVEFVANLGLAFSASQSLVKTSFVPASYNGRPQEAAAAIVTGLELGLSPLAALRSIDVINGTPALRAVALRALVQSHGHLIWTEESSKVRAVVRAQRKDSDIVETSTWDMERARELGLSGKDNWKKQPTAMLLARATAEAVRLIAADLILGLPYIAEELDEVTAVPAVGAPAVKPASRTVRRKPVEPVQVEEKAPEAVAEPAVVVANPIAESKPELVKAEPKKDELYPDNALTPLPEELAEWGSLPEGFK